MQTSQPAERRGWRKGPVGAAAKAAFRAALSAQDVIRGGVLDLADRLTGRRRPLTPPRRLWPLVTGRSNTFHESGEGLRDFLVARGLTPEHDILDVGCGIGRLAVPLTGYLAPTARYEGFDIMPKAIRWCQTITRSHPNFRFRLADVHSDRYHKAGRQTASAYVFPYPDNAFDRVVLGSVFSHMFPADIVQYLSQIARVLKPGGESVISCYLLTDEKRALVANGGSAFSFAHPGPGYWAEVAELPEAAIAYDQTWMLAAYQGAGLEIVEVLDGVWASQPVQGQDIVIARKPPVGAAA